MSQRNKEGRYKRLRERANEGRLELVEPLDYLIIENLVDEGTLMGNYYPLGTTVESLRKKFDGLTSDQIGGRLRSMEIQGLTKIIKIGGKHGHAWQRTQRGKEVLAEWKERQS